MARGHPPPHCENTQVLREAITEDDYDDDETRTGHLHTCKCLYWKYVVVAQLWLSFQN